MNADADRTPAVIAAGLRKSYNGRVAVDGIDFVVEQGVCFGFLGPNGAGKTTTMKMIYGLGSIDGGELAVLGMDAARQRRAVKQRLGVVPQETNLDGELSVRENLLYHARYFGIDPAIAATRAEELLSFSLLDDRGGDRVWALSGGMKRRLLVARALINEPDLVVLDEPTTGLDPQARLAVWRALDRLKRRGVTLLITTHYMEEAARLCDRLVIMDHGRIVTEGEPGALVLEHVGREVLELRLAEGCDADGLLATLDGRVDGHDLAEDLLMLYTSDAEALLAEIDDRRYPHDSALVRRATLEDVFLRLTGRSLRE
ncbi:MAG TPA: ABC transporter ATP-binding protein [Solirubrobacterales bacterium]|nr:ABC transporter ATP-binding protein [Solirubrobacterales bacterium]